MAYFPVITEAGQGGRLGRSRMTRWGTAEEIRQSSKHKRRVESRIEIQAQLWEEWVWDRMPDYVFWDHMSWDLD